MQLFQQMFFVAVNLKACCFVFGCDYHADLTNNQKKYMQQALKDVYQLHCIYAVVRFLFIPACSNWKQEMWVKLSVAGA